MSKEEQEELRREFWETIVCKVLAVPFTIELAIQYADAALKAWDEHKWKD